MTKDCPVCVYVGADLGRYGFGGGHPLNPERLEAFWQGFKAAGLEPAATVCAPIQAERTAIERFHAPAYIERVIRQSKTGEGYLDYGDTPAFPGVYEAAATVVGSTLDALDRLMHGHCRRAFVPIGGLHHARRDSAAGFCVFNDCGVAIETLKSIYHQTHIAYVDIDAHHGDGVFYGFEDDPTVIVADIHEDGRFLYPGTGAAHETGKGLAVGTKLNIPLLPHSDDKDFRQAWSRVEDFLIHAKPSFILFQCGADSLADDPLTHLGYSPKAHAYAAERLCEIADRYCQGRILGLGGGGYNLRNIAAAWTAVVRAFLR